MPFDETQDKKILAIETSCDETAIAIVECSGGIMMPCFKILSNIIASQIKVHAPFGGVVPNLAKREHQKNLMPVLLQALTTAGMLDLKVKTRKSKLQIKIQNLLPPPINAIAVTIGPGLAPALWVGVNFAKELAQKWEKPILPVNHMIGHIASVLLSQTATNETSNKSLRCISAYRDVATEGAPRQGWGISKKKIIFPALALLVSGGHTELVLMENWQNKKIIGETLDDAAGEAFDKVARMLELGYPGGPIIAKEARGNKKISSQLLLSQKLTPYIPRSSSNTFLPRPLLHSKDYNFSFSGLKTAVLYLVEKLKKQDISIKTMRPFIAKEFQDAVVDVLVAKTIRAAKEYNAKTVILGGGVAANNLLRETLAKEIKKQLPASSFRLPAIQFTGDNAAMIAAAAYLSPRKTSWTKFKAIDRLRV